MNTEIISLFMSKVKGAISSKSEEVRLSTSDAQLLMLAISDLLMTKVKEESASPTVMSVDINGGPLKPK